MSAAASQAKPDGSSKRQFDSEVEDEPAQLTNMALGGLVMPDRDASRQVARKKHIKVPQAGGADSRTPASSPGFSKPAQLFPDWKGTAPAIEILKMEQIRREAVLLLHQLPPDIRRWEAAMNTCRDCDESLRRAEADPAHPNSELLKSMCDHVLESTKCEIACHREIFEVLRAKWVWLRLAAESEMCGFAPYLGRLDRGVWADAPTPSVFPWLEAVHDEAVRRAAELRNARVRFKEPIALKTVSEQLSERVDLIRNKLNNMGRLIGGALRNPVAELEDVVECFPEHAASLRRLVRS